MTSVRLFRKRAIEDAVTRTVSSRTVFSHLRPTLQIWAPVEWFLLEEVPGIGN